MYMIDLKQLSEAHKGAKVVYINRSQDGRLLVREWGHISSWNERGIFVRFPDRQTSQLCRPETLFDYDEYELFYDKSEKADLKDTWGWDIMHFVGEIKMDH